MFEPGFSFFTCIARLPARRHPAASRRANSIGDTMSSHIATTPLPACRRPRGRIAAALTAFLLPAILAMVPLVGVTTTAALACACGCSVFDVGGLDTPQEQDHGGRIFFEFWSGDQNAELCRQFQSSGRAQYGQGNQYPVVQCRLRIHVQPRLGRDGADADVNRTLTTETDVTFPGEIQTFKATDIGDIEVMGMYTGFFPDMSTGVIFGLKLPTGTLHRTGFRSRYPDRDRAVPI